MVGKDGGANSQAVLAGKNRRVAANHRRIQRSSEIAKPNRIVKAAKRLILLVFLSGDPPMRTPSVISDDELKAADGIHTFDPADLNAAGHQLWGNRTQESDAQTNTDARIVELPLPSDDHVALLALISRIEKVKGRLPPDVEVLRKNLST